MFNNNNWMFIDCFSFSKYSDIKKPIKKIALILESPHKDEYRINNALLIPQRPANGKTGKAIESYIAKYASLWELDKNTNYEVHLINAVQVQASCYHELKALNVELSLYYRNLLKHWVLTLLFDDKEFINRIKNIKPDILVNCCTKKPTNIKQIKKDIYEEVQSAIDQYVEEHHKVISYKCYHPSSYAWTKMKMK